MIRSALLILLLAGFGLQAQEIYRSDRPGQSFSSQVLQQGSLQWQQGFEWRDFYLNNPGAPLVVQQRWLNSDIALRYGLGYDIEIGLNYQYGGLNNPLLDNEFAWEGSNPGLMLRAALPGSNGQTFEWAFIVQSSFDNLDYRLSASIYDGPWGFTGNLGFYHDEFIDYTAQWSVLLAYSKDRYSIFAEVYGLSLNSANSDYLAFDAGFSFALKENFSWDIYAGNQLGSSPAVGLFANYFLNTGFTWRIR